MAKKQRIDKVLTNLGYGSRKDIRKLCKSGLITVDGEVITDSGFHIDPKNQRIMVGNELVIYSEFVHIMLNKPSGVISATEDDYHHTVIDLLEPKYKAMSLFPVGRLDKDTEGLLLLTNDGQLAHRLLSPKKHIPKTYYAVVRGTVTEEDILRFQEGVVLEDGYKTLPADLQIFKAGDRSEIQLTIYEGKFHQVKRMFLVVGKPVVYLKRIAMGNLHLDENLKLGEYRNLTEEELEQLKG